MAARLDRVLVPVDFSKESIQALEYAVELTRPFRAELLVLFVLEPMSYATPADLYGPSANLSMLQEEQRRVATEQLKRLAARWKRRGVAVRTLLEAGTPHEVITDLARRRRVDLIVMATHGRTGVSHLLLGSVAERVIRTATCPVLTVRRLRRARKRR